MKNCRQCQSENHPTMFAPGDAPQYPSSDAVYLEMNRMAGAYPFITLSEYGRSVLGRPLLYICAGTGPRKVWYNASHHANEWITTTVLLKFMDELFSKSQSGGSVAGLDAARLLRENRLCFMPLVNPDGVDLVLGKLGQTEVAEARRIARSYPEIPFPSGWKANLRGTDLNLQYPANWEKAREIKFSQGYVSPAPRDYVGPYPLSAPESRSLAAFTQAGSPDVTLSLHTQGEVIYWRFADFDPPGARELGEKLSEASGYVLSETPPVSDNAGYKDWFIQEWNRPGYTVEMGSGINPLPMSDFPEIYAHMAPLLAVAANG
ncbi:MAG: M14 family metallopeptidase [Oscillospiraceae bacterium]